MQSSGESVTFSGRFREQFVHLWMMNVTGFRSDRHCLPCLKGKRIDIGNCERRIDLSHVADGDLVYLCGVAKNRKWSDNFHLAARKTGYPLDVAAAPAAGGGGAIIVGFSAIAFDDEAARAQYPDLGKEFLTCRNFQFGAQLFPRS